MLKVIFSNNKLLFAALILSALVFLMIFAFTLHYADSESSALDDKVTNYLNQISSMSAFSVNTKDYESVQDDLQPFCKNREIAYIKVYDENNNSIFQCDNGISSVVSKKGELKVGGFISGYYEIGVSDLRVHEKAKKILNALIAANMFNLWNYNTDLIVKSTASFFRDKDITSLEIVDAAGYSIAKYNRRYPEGTTFRFSENIDYRGKTIGTVHISLSDYRMKLYSKNFNILKYFSVLACSIILMFIPFLVLRIKSNYINAYKRYINREKTFDVLKEQKKFPSWKITETTREKIISTIEYINNNYNRNISREGLAEMVGINPDNLGRYFKLYTGTKLIDYIYGLRIDKAANDIVHTDKSICQVANDCGFDHLGTFYRVFNKHMKITPADFRRISLEQKASSRISKNE